MIVRFGSANVMSYTYTGNNPLNATDPSGLCANGLPVCPWETVGQVTDAAATAAHTGYDFVTATGGSFARTIGNGVVGTYATLAEAARLTPVTGPFLDGGIGPYLLHVSGDLSDAAVTANHLDIAWGLVSQSVAAPFQAALACPSATTIGNAAGDTLGNLALLFGPAKAAGLVRRVGVLRSLPATDYPSSAANGARLAQQLMNEEAASGLVHINQPAEASTAIGGIFSNPAALRSMIPEELTPLVEKAPGWRIGRLQQGSHAGQGWTLREEGGQGYIQWHPGGGRHGGVPYWKVSSGDTGVVWIPQGPGFLVHGKGTVLPFP